MYLVYFNFFLFLLKGNSLQEILRLPPNFLGINHHALAGHYRKVKPVLQTGEKEVVRK